MKKIINALKLTGLLALLFIGITACNKSEDINSNTDQVADDSFVINNNFEDLNTRMSIVREPIVVDDNFKTVPVPDDCNDYTWMLVAELEAPKFQGEPLSATDVRILENRAYVTYHRQGLEYIGGLEIIDISNPGFPSVISYMEFTDTDINSLAIDDLGSSEGDINIWLAGSSYKKGAVLRQVTANNGELTTEVLDIPLSRAFLDGSITPSANGIGLSDEYIYMSSGNNVGGTFQLDKQTLEILSYEEYSDAKAIALNGGADGDYQLTLVAGDNGKLNVHRVGADRSLVNSWNLGQIIHQNVDELDSYLGKATVSIREGEDIAFIAMNSRGAKGINIDTGEEVYYSPSGMLTTGNTHGLTIDDKFIYMANSEDGLFIGCIPEDGGEIIEVLHWDLDESYASANMVQTDGEWVFVAKGGGGLKILQKIAKSDLPDVCDDYDDDGKPGCVNREQLCENLVENFRQTLHEGRNAKNNNPEYFQNQNREVVLTEDAVVSVCFVSENAQYKNSFGYYTYNVNNPPQSVDDIKGSMKVIFANASAANSGGSLEGGDCVNLGSFPSGTAIGYFVIANGWNGRKVTEGLETYYTTPRFNRNSSQQSIMMYDESCGSLLTTFEDMHPNNGRCDNDYNDIVVKTNISPMSAMNTVEVVHFPEGK